MFLPLRAVSDAPAVEAELKQIAVGHLASGSHAGADPKS